MRSLPCSTLTRVFLLFVLFLALAAPYCMAQPAASDTSTANFLATLSTAPPSNGTAPLQAPTPIFLSGCTSSAQCPTGQLCCLACGYSDCDRHACFTPVNGHCPFFP